MRIPKHVGIIPDGNRRWAQSNGLNKEDGYPEALDSLPPLQAEILDNCAAFVRPGGLLVYSTCTILPAENADRIAAFLEKHPGFQPDPDASWLPERLRGGYSDGMIQLLPCRDGVEGFFIARLRRKRT